MALALLFFRGGGTASAPTPPLLPPVDTGSVPGFVPGRSGPHKRPGQVFGEEYAPSPFLTNAVRAALGTGDPAAKFGLASYARAMLGKASEAVRAVDEAAAATEQRQGRIGRALAILRLFMEM